MWYSDYEKLSLYNTPVSELEIVDINNLVPNTLYLYEYNDIDHEDDVEKAVVEFINLIGRNRNYVVGKTLTDRYGNITDNQFNEFMVDPSERDHYKFYKRTHPTGLHEEIKQGTDLKSGLHPKSYIPTQRELAYKNLPPDQKDEYYNAHKERLVPPPPYKGGLKRKITKKRNSKRKRSRLLRGKTKTKTKTRRQKKSPPHQLTSTLEERRLLLVHKIRK